MTLGSDKPTGEKQTTDRSLYGAFKYTLAKLAGARGRTTATQKTLLVQAYAKMDTDLTTAIALIDAAKAFDGETYTD